MLCDLSGRLLIGLSGGGDSVALLLRLLSLGNGAQLRAIHVNHGLRGEESDGDEAFVRQLCLEKRVPLTVRRLQPPEHPSEDWAREARYAAFSEVYHAWPADALVLAHHLDDQAETVLMHLLRGSGLNGLTGMRPESRQRGMRILRPLLDTPRETLRRELEEQNQPWREDSSNASDRYLRNRVRHELLPLMDSLNPGNAARLGRTALLLSRDSDCLEETAADFLRQYPGRQLPLEALQALHPALTGRILSAWTGQKSGEVLRRLEELPGSKTGTSLALPDGRQVFRGNRFLHLVEEEAPPAPQSSQAERLEMNGVIIRRSSPAKGPGDGRRSQSLPAALLRECCWRTRQPGDRIRPFGMEGSQSLQDYFVNRRIDAPFRGRIPLLARGSEILLAAGVGAGAIPRWRAGEDYDEISFSGEMPWLEEQER